MDYSMCWILYGGKLDEVAKQLLFFFSIFERGGEFVAKNVSVVDWDNWLRYAENVLKLSSIVMQPMFHEMGDAIKHGAREIEKVANLVSESMNGVVSSFVGQIEDGISDIQKFFVGSDNRRESMFNPTKPVNKKRVPMKMHGNGGTSNINNTKTYHNTIIISNNDEKHDFLERKFTF